MKSLITPEEHPDADLGSHADFEAPIYRLDDYVTVWLDHARAGRAIAALRDAHINMLKSELSALRELLDEPRP